MSIAAGDRLGPYEVESCIGEGGMGEVWRARDTRLGRSVAIKVLPSEFAQDEGLRLRFEREARVISQLNHPHICSIFDVGENYLVMELLDGKSLADRLVRGPLPLSDVVRYGAQIAEALDRAHRAGIVHRDLKPGNVMITRTGAKLLDFGLAKSMRIEVDTDGETQQKSLTAEGTILGTFPYMAPEQLEGKEADARTDIFAFGALLYEMVTGRRAFDEKSGPSLIAAIVSGEPQPISELQPFAPPAIEHLIAKCLSKDPDDRWQSAHDVAEELRWIGSAPSTGAKTPSRWPERLALIAALVVVGAVAAWLAMRPQPRADAIEASILPDGNNGLDRRGRPPAFSPDGKWLVYSAVDAAGNRLLWRRSMEGGASQPMAVPNGADTPFWSPDGRFVGFNTFEGQLQKIAVTGGRPEPIAKSCTGWTWNRDDTILCTSNDGLSRVSASGGEPALVINRASLGATLVMFASFLPDQNHFIFVARGGPVEQRSQSGIWVATVDGSEKPHFLVHASSNAVYVEPGFLLFSRDGVLRAQPFDAKRLRLHGSAMAIAPVQNDGVGAIFAASGSGLLVFQRQGSGDLSELVIKNREGRVVRKIGDVACYFSPRISPDGRRIAVDRSNEKLEGDVWILRIDNGAPSRFSFDPRNEGTPVWSPRGDEIAYSFDEQVNHPETLRKRVGESPRLMVGLPSAWVMPTDWSPDGRHLAVMRKSGNLDVVVWSIEEKTWIDIATTTANEAAAVFSGDGKWIAYQSNENGVYEIYVQPFPPTGTKYQVSPAGGVTPRWSGNEISYVDSSSRLTVVTVTTAPLFATSTPRALFRIEMAQPVVPQHDAMLDGNFLVNEPVPGQAKPLTLLVNWTNRLEQPR